MGRNPLGTSLRDLRVECMNTVNVRAETGVVFTIISISVVCFLRCTDSNTVQRWLLSLLLKAAAVAAALHYRANTELLCTKDQCYRSPAPFFCLAAIGA